MIENTSSVWIPLDNARYVLSWIAAPSPMFAECPSPHSIISAPDSAIDLNISKLDSLQLSTSELNALKASINNLDTQLILLDDSVQALNNYKNQLNQVILEIQTDISSIQLPSNQNTTNQNWQSA